MKVKKKEIQLLLSIAGVLIAVAAYYLVYNNYTEKAAAIESENAALATEVARLQALADNRDTYITKTEEMKEYITNFELLFPADILYENSIMMVKHMEDGTDTTVDTIGFGGITEVPYSGTHVPADGSTGYFDSRLYDVPLSLNIACTYDDFKGLVEYIYGQQERMSIKGVNISYNSETGTLGGSMTMDTYFLSGTDKLYEEPEIPRMGMGVETIFGNVE